MAFDGDAIKEVVGHLSIRKGTFFENSHLELSQIVDVIYMYAYNTATTKSIMRECNLATEAITNWKNFIRDIAICSTRA